MLGAMRGNPALDVVGKAVLEWRMAHHNDDKVAEAAARGPSNSGVGRRVQISALIGFLGVGLGAFGAHGLEKLDLAPGRLEIWKTAVFYHLLHAVMLYLVAVSVVPRAWAWNCLAAGVLVFSGSLYLLVLTGTGWLGAITPIGGVSLLAGWVLLAIRPGGEPKR